MPIVRRQARRCPGAAGERAHNDLGEYVATEIFPKLLSERGCVDTSTPSLQQVGRFFVGHLEVAPHALGTLLKGELINPTSLSYSNIRFIVRSGGLGPVDMSVLPTVRAGGSTRFQVVVHGLNPKDATRACFEYQSATMGYLGR